MKTSQYLLPAIASAALWTAAQAHGQTPGSAAPPFTLKKLDGAPASLSDYAGHPVLINFWATWCRPCRDEMPLIIDAYRAHQPEGLAVLAVDLTQQEGSKKDVLKFVTEFQMSFPVLLDEKSKVSRSYALHGLPTSFFVGSDGIVRAVNPGPVSKAALQQHLSEILPQP